MCSAPVMRVQREEALVPSASLACAKAVNSAVHLLYAATCNAGTISSMTLNYQLLSKAAEHLRCLEASDKVVLSQTHVKCNNNKCIKVPYLKMQLV